jgi:hypothetical protein
MYLINLKKMIYKCRQCDWKGEENELDYETTDGCFGNDTLEICPECGSEEVFVVFPLTP